MPVIQQQNGVKSVKGLPAAWGVRAYEEMTAALADGVQSCRYQSVCADLDDAVEDLELAEKLVRGLPAKWADIARSELAAKRGAGRKSQGYIDLCQVLTEVASAPFPIDATDAHLCVLAQIYANDCASNAATIHDTEALRARMAYICKVRGIDAPDCDDDSQAIARCTDARWWRKKLRTLHGRTFEAAAIRLGMVSSQKEKYCSRETVERRMAQNERNAASLASVMMQNLDTDEEVTLASLAEKGMGNKKVRRGEMMMRMAGCDKVAKSLGHRGLFVTLTAPSSYHAVLQKSGDANPKFNGATPIDTHRYLNNLWKLTRAKNDRDGIAPYGFRVAEPHHDGCTHWHMLFFMPAKHIQIFVRNLSRYALAEDGNEKGARKTRVTYKALDPAKGQAAGYMAKYVSKNIGENVAEKDLFGKAIITSAMRVDAWAGTWGIRQFQPIGQPPVTVWREFRRLDADKVKSNDVPAHIKLAHSACQRIESKTEKDEQGNPLVIHAADWAEYVEAQGGVKVGKVTTKTRDYSGARVLEYKSKAKKGTFYFRGIKTRTKVQPLMSQGRVGGFAIGLCAPDVMSAGRYGLALAAKPVGVFCRAETDVIYKSTRYTWKQTGRAVGLAFQGVAGGADFDVPWSPVNNCTDPDWFTHSAPGELVAEFDDAWFESDEYRKNFVPAELVEDALTHAIIVAHEIRDSTVWTRLSSDKLRGKE